MLGVIVHYPDFVSFRFGALGGVEPVREQGRIAATRKIRQIMQDWGVTDVEEIDAREES